MVTCKKGVDYQALLPVCKVAANQLKSIFLDFGYDMVLTSTTEGEHSARSLHYHGLAFDVRSRTIRDDDLQPLIKRIQQRLSVLDKRFQLVIEGNHFHIEFDRRK
jgi:hypothetical protein